MFYPHWCHALVGSVRGKGVWDRAKHMAPSSPLITTVVAGGFGAGSGWSGVVGVRAGIGGCGGARDLLNPSTSMSNTPGFLHTSGSVPTLESGSGRNTDLDHLQPGCFTEEFTEVDFGGSRVISFPPHLSRIFGSWNTSEDRGSNGLKWSSGINLGTNPAFGTIGED